MISAKGNEAAPEHRIKSDEQEFGHLRQLITRMGGLVESQVLLARYAVVCSDNIAATRAIELGSSVDALEREIEQLVVGMIALRQSVADDLRHLVAALKTIVDLGRIGDYATNVANRSIVLGRFSITPSLSRLGHMATLVRDALNLVMDAIGNNDAEKAIQVWHSDQAVDDIYNTIVREMVTYMMEDPRSIGACMHLLFIAKNLERIGDRATNIAETVYYAATGEVLTEAPLRNTSVG